MKFSSRQGWKLEFRDDLAEIFIIIISMKINERLGSGDELFLNSTPRLITDCKTLEHRSWEPHFSKP